MKTTVVSLRKGSPRPPVGPYVRIDRGTKWGNPYVVGIDGTREECIEKYREGLRGSPKFVEAARRELKGKQIACWCAPLPCHGDVLAAVADGAEP